MIHECDGVAATDNILSAIFRLDKKTVASASIVAEVIADHNVVEVAPITEITGTAAKPQPSGRGVESVNVSQR